MRPRSCNNINEIQTLSNLGLADLNILLSSISKISSKSIKHDPSSRILRKEVSPSGIGLSTFLLPANRSISSQLSLPEMKRHVTAYKRQII